MRKSFDRRQFLAGSTGFLALPTLLSAGGSQSETQPRRIVCIGNSLGFWPGGFFPQSEGKNYELSSTLQPLAPHKDEFTVFSNLDHEAKGGHHAVHNLLSGIKREEASGFEARNISLDQRAAEHIGSTTRYRSIAAGIGEGTELSWSRAGVRIPPVTNPSRLFDALFVETSQSSVRQKKARIQQRGSVLDALRESVASMNKRLNSTDKSKLDQYLTSVREVERQLQQSQAWIDSPKPKSPIAPVLNEEREQIEEIPLFFDLLTLALQTDSTRIATFEIPTRFRTSELNLPGYHSLSHHGKDEERLEQLQIVETYLFDQFSRFLSGLQEAHLFDHTAVVIGSGLGNGSSHSNRNLPIVLAGGGLPHAGHLICPEEQGKRVPLSNLWLSMLQWFGVETDQFGRSTGTFSPMNIV